MADKLPPLNPLKVFEAVARLNSITKASNELFVTQAAVSRQVYVLEDYLQQQLFVHRRGKISLTEQGQAYFEAISPSLKKVAEATGALMKNRNRNVVRVKTYQTFAQFWLIPRLAGFRAHFPDIEVHILTQIEPVDESHINNDVIIQFGDKRWPGYSATKILNDDIVPVCSPAFAAEHGLNDDPQAISRATRLQATYRRRDWTDWLASVGLPDDDAAQNMIFQSSGLAYEAARQGLGVALGQVALLAHDLRSGALVMPSRKPLRRPLGYYLLFADNVVVEPVQQKFIDWLLAEVA